MPSNEELLSILEAHGQQFLQSFESISARSTKRRAASREASPRRTTFSQDISDSSSEEEWTGIQHDGKEYSAKDSDSDMDLDAGDLEFEQDDDGFTAGCSISTRDKNIVFTEKFFRKEAVSKIRMKAFMSSKVSKLRDDDLKSFPKSRGTTQEEEEERTNAENDALLHKLVHTKLLSGSLSSDLDMTPAHRRRALAGRVMELAGGAKLGKGERAIREAEKCKAGKSVREGLARKQSERERQNLEEAKNLGNYHPALKKLFEASNSSTSSRSKSRGLNMGVGKFCNGVLQLSKQDIASVTGRAHRNKGRKRR